MQADQFDDRDPKQRADKGRFFNWFYFSINTGHTFASCFSHAVIGPFILLTGAFVSHTAVAYICQV